MINVDGIAYVKEVTILTNNFSKITVGVDNGRIDILTIFCNKPELKEELINSVGKFLIFIKLYFFEYCF